MSNGSEGRKKSQFIQQSTVPGSATFDFVIDGVNRKITLTDLITLFGTTGTLEQVGNVLGTPILNKSGSVNNIRNLEPGPGILTAVSPENGATISHNFAQDTVGAPVLLDPTAAQPTIASILAGSGISVSLSDKQVTISTSDLPTSTKTVVVNQLSDLPDPVAEVITLQSNTEYFLTNDINFGNNRVVISDSTAFRGSDELIIKATYTGTGVFITGVDASCRLKTINLDVPNGTVFDFSNSAGNENTSNVIMDNVDVANCQNLGNITNLAIFAVFRSNFRNITVDGIKYFGFISVVTINISVWTLAAGTFSDLGTAAFFSFEVNNFFSTFAAGTKFLDGLPNSGNIVPGGLGRILLGRFLGAGTPLTNITTDDALWEFSGNNAIANTRPDGLLSMQGNAVATVISGAGDPVLVAGTWVIERVGQMTGDAAGRLTYDGGKDAPLPITSSLTVAPVSGGSIEISAEIAINGTAIPNSKRTASSSSGNPSSITIPWQEVFAPADFVEVFVTNEDSTVNVLVSSAIHRVN